MKKQTPTHSTNDSLKAAFTFSLLWLVVSGICVLANVPIWGVLLIVNLPILFVPALIEMATKTKLPIALQIQFHVLITTTSFLGSILGFYASVPNWDTYVHCYSGTLAAWFGFFVVRQAEDRAGAAFPKWFAVATALSIAMAIGALWEIYEYLSDILLHTNMQVGGLEDTMIDMIFATIGALVAVGVAVWFKSPKSVLPKSLQPNHSK